MRRFHSSTPSPVRSLRRRTDMSFIPCQSRACAIVTTPSSGYADCRIRRKRFPKTRESRPRVQAVVKTPLRLVFSVDARCPEVAYEYFFSISAKKALASRTKSASLTLISSAGLSFSTDLSGGSWIPEPAEFGHPGSLSICSLLWLYRIELQMTRTSFNGLPSLPSMPVSRCTNMYSREYLRRQLDDPAAAPCGRC